MERDRDEPEHEKDDSRCYGMNWICRGPECKFFEPNRRSDISQRDPYD